MEPTAGAGVGADVGQRNYSRISLTIAGSEVGQPNSTTGADIGQFKSTTGVDVNQPNSTTGVDVNQHNSTTEIDVGPPNSTTGVDIISTRVDVDQPNFTTGEHTGQPNSSKSSSLLSLLPLLTSNACNSVYLLYVSFGNASPLTPFFVFETEPMYYVAQDALELAIYIQTGLKLVILLSQAALTLTCRY